MTNVETTSSKAIDPADQLCEQCGHNWDAHLLYGYGSPPTEGWMECPVEGCGCKKTWGLSPEMTAQMKTHALKDGVAPANLPSENEKLFRRKPATLLAFVAVLLIIGALVIFGLLS